jgi:hypothetical protein
MFVPYMMEILTLKRIFHTIHLFPLRGSRTCAKNFKVFMGTVHSQGL